MPEPCLRCICTKRAFIVYLKFKFRESCSLSGSSGTLHLLELGRVPTRRPEAPPSRPTWAVHWEPGALACALRDESCWSRGRGIHRKVPSVGTPWRVLTPREPVTTFTTGIPTFPSRVLRPRCICGRTLSSVGGAVQLDEHLQVFSAG